MKTAKALLIWFLISIGQRCLAQEKADIITLLNGESITCTIANQSKTDIYYQAKEGKGQTFVIPIADIKSVAYWNGEKVIFTELPPQASTNPTQTTVMPVPYEMYSKGLLDGENVYERYGGAAKSTFIVSLLNPVLGLVPAIACASMVPADRNLMLPPSTHISDPNYLAGYREAAYKKKKKAVWNSFGQGAVLSVFALIIILRLH
jgi:hypothetical protein